MQFWNLARTINDVLGSAIPKYKIATIFNDEQSMMVPSTGKWRIKAEYHRVVTLLEILVESIQYHS